MEKFEVGYTIKHTNKSSENYGVLLERKAKFDSLQDAIKFIRGINDVHKNDVKVIGKPTLERAA